MPAIPVPPDYTQQLDKINPVLGAFKRRVGREFSEKILLAVTVSPVKAVIEGIVLDRKKEERTEA